MESQELWQIISKTIFDLATKQQKDNHRNIVLNVDSVLEESGLNISLATFRRLCHAHFQCSPIQVIHQIRLEKAKALMKTSKSIGEIATLCGYPNHGKLTKAFKKYYGVPPSEFRNKLRE